MKNIGIVSLLFSITFLILLVPEVGEDFKANALLGQDYDSYEARLFPYLIGIITFIISIIMIIKGWLKGSKSEQTILSQINLDKLKDVGILIIISLLYIISLEIIGFFIMTPICIIVTLCFFGISNWVELSIIPVLTTLLVFVCFELLMGIQLPKGVLEWMFY